MPLLYMCHVRVCRHGYVSRCRIIHVCVYIYICICMHLYIHTPFPRKCVCTGQIGIPYIAYIYHTIRVYLRMLAVCRYKYIHT